MTLCQCHYCQMLKMTSFNTQTRMQNSYRKPCFQQLSLCSAINKVLVADVIGTTGSSVTGLGCWAEHVDHNHTCTLHCNSYTIGVGDGARDMCPQISGKNIFWANVMKNSGILLIFHTYIFPQKKSCPPQLTQLPHLCRTPNILYKLTTITMPSLLSNLLHTVHIIHQCRKY